MTYTPDYPSFVASRLKDGGDILRSLTADEANLLHLALGVAGEVGEFIDGAAARDKSNCKEEAGDICFFIQGIENHCRKFRDVDFSPAWTTSDDSDEDTLFLMAAFSGKIVDAIKKHVVYRKDLDLDELVVSCTFLISHLAIMAKRMGFTLRQAREDNIEKLLKRYATGYSDKAAQERADK